MIRTPESLSECDSAPAAVAALSSWFCSRQTWLGTIEAVEPIEVPSPYHGLLVHHEHMTTILQTFYGRGVALQVLREHREADLYTRAVLLTLGAAKRVVEFGIARVDLALTSAAVREEILQRRTPLGDILIRYDVLRRIDPKWYFRMDRDSPLLDDGGRGRSAHAYGRVGVISFEGRPAIELIEIVLDADGPDESDADSDRVVRR